ncbi:DUF2345 domain-containing protein [Martelella alba]|uniref:DUF2345 domain-containing protein n=1 Tax=Martelella alba TaxID=2590451 RepID=UPI001E2846B6|nr:DUF2345 domain-containing protein [Martelella alba]
MNQLLEANRQMQALNGAAEQAQALTCDIQAQHNLLRDRLEALKSAVVMACAPQGIAFTSGEHIQLTSAQNTMINAGRHLDMGAMNNITVSAEQALGLFAHQSGARLIADLGDIEVRAQHGRLEMSAEQQFTIASGKDEVVISTPKTLTLNGGGAYLKLSQHGIEHGTHGDFVIKAARYQVPMTAAILQSERPACDKSLLDLLPSATEDNLSR